MISCQRFFYAAIVRNNVHQCRHILSGAVQNRIDALVSEHDSIVEKLNAGGTQSLGEKLAKLSPVARLKEKMDELYREEESLKELLTDAKSLDDEEVADECLEELQKLDETKEKLEKRMIDSILPTDEQEMENTILEIRAGTGGDEAALFAGELLESYTKSARSQGWKVETLNITKTDLGGIKEASLSITGGGGASLYYEGDLLDDESNAIGPYGFFKYESGVHRVQRVPVNDVRIHTSACSVAVLPSPSDSQSDELLPASELRIETMRASGAGGQHVNTTDSAVRVTHIPTGITASIQDERSQHKNKTKALRLIAARVWDQRREEAARERGEARNSLMGGGDRSERIRTYNFPQDRVTDHRCKESEHGIVRLLNGSEDGLINTFAPSMRAQAREKLLEEIEEQT
mmetsp:Transcript_20951/g.31040  ORF Transcript_20951/g.31040 Transcript_20951/m.31040 type:complete len:405 (+) Transcript_20951:129-1343(+)